MDWMILKSHTLKYIEKYRYLIIIFLLGILLLILPPKKESTAVPTPELITSTDSLQSSLRDILSLVSGAGNVEVLLTEAKGEKIHFQLDEEISDGKARKEAVLITNTEREETGLIQQINPPEYLGAVVICQGADNAVVRLSIVEAVMSVTGLTSDHITVLKMK